MRQSDLPTCQLYCQDALPALPVLEPDFTSPLSYLPDKDGFFEQCPWEGEPLAFSLPTNSHQAVESNLSDDNFVKPSYFTPFSQRELPDFQSDYSDESRDESIEPADRQRAIFKAKTVTPRLSQATVRVRGCGCQTSNCLRRYCKCFANKGYCGDGCGCVDCFNTLEFEEERKVVIEKTEEICRGSFAPKFASTKDGVKINAEGCRCKSGCRSKLCLCSKNGVGCSPICRCSGCTNSKIELEPEEVKRLFRNPTRTKERLIISPNAARKSDKPFVEEVSYKGIKGTVVVFNRSETDTRTCASGRNFLPS